MEFGAFVLDKGSIKDKLGVLFEKITKIIELYSPEILSLEKLFFNKNAKTVLGVGEARGVIILSAVLKSIEIVEFTPLEVKQAITGYGRATKKQVQYMVKSILGFSEIPKPDDAADALAIALTCAYTNKQMRKI